MGALKINKTRLSVGKYKISDEYSAYHETWSDFYRAILVPILRVMMTANS